MAAEASSPKASSPHKIDLRSVSAVVGWADAEPQALGASLSSTPASLDLDFDSTSRTASFRLRIVLSQRRPADKTVPIYLMIHSQQIQSVVEPVPAQAQVDAEVSRDKTHHLLLHLKDPPTLIMPPEPLHPKDKTQTALLRSVRSAARRHALSIYIRHGILSRPQLSALCEAAYQEFGPSSRLGDIVTFYGGRGGKVVECAELGGPVESPPSYNELGAGPPMPPMSYDSDAATSSKKRRLTSPDTREFDISLVENICKKICAEQYATLRAELSASEARIVDRLDQRLNDRFSGLNEDYQARLKKLEGQIQAIKDDFSRLDETCHGDLETLEERIQEVSDDVDWRVDNEVEDRVLGIKIDLEDYVKDELRNTEDILKQRLAEASFSLQFNE